MAEQKWTMRGEYMESCNCDYLCPCIYTNPQAPVTYDHCTAALVFRIDEGSCGSTHLNGLKFTMVIRSGKVMADGNWIFAGVVDERADEAQRQVLSAIVCGQAGGPPAMLAPLIGEMLGVEKAPIIYSEDGRGHHVRIGEAIDVGVEDFVAIEGQDPVQLTNVFHPSNTTLTVAPANAAHLSTFGVDWGREGQSGFSAPFSWSG